MVSDVSFKENLGKTELIIEGDSSSRRRITVKWNTLGHSEEHEAYRSEIYGIIYGVMIIKHICKNQNISEGNITPSCNIMDTTRTAIEKDTAFLSRSNHFDIILSINANINESPTQCNWDMSRATKTTIAALSTDGQPSTWNATRLPRTYGPRTTRNLNWQGKNMN